MMFATQKASRFMAMSAIPVATTFYYYQVNASNSNAGVASCEQEQSSSTTRFKKSSGVVHLRKRMTPMGRFALKSETNENPSIPTFFLALAGGKPTYEPPSIVQRLQHTTMGIPELEELFMRRNFFLKHDRFQSKISKEDDRFFEPSSNDLRNYIKETLHYSIYRSELKRQIEYMLTSPLDVNQRLWEANISSGKIGSSGAISSAKVRDMPNEEEETVILFRAHHALADGVSLGAAISDLSDEADQIQESIQLHLETRKQNNKKRKHLSWLKRLFQFLQKAIGFWFIGSIRVLSQHFYLMIFSVNPFDAIIQQATIAEEEERQQRTRSNAAPSDSRLVVSTRSVSWCDAAPIDQVKQLANSVTPKATLNDVFVACVSYAITKQLEEHKLTGMSSVVVVPRNINIVIPVHFSGGVLLPGESMGNRIGAMVVPVPAHLSTTSSSVDRLKLVSQALSDVKSTPAACIAYTLAKFCSKCFPESWTKIMFRCNNCHATAVVSNVRGAPNKMHWNGRDVVSIAGFLPLPPGIPIGVVVQSYDGMVSLTVTADRKAVPDADKFLSWVLEEYQRMRVVTKTSV